MACPAYLVVWFEQGAKRLLQHSIELRETWEPLLEEDDRIPLLLCSEFGDTFNHACNRIIARLETDVRLRGLVGKVKLRSR